jgi:Bacterial low temperature requirement A protein (LtrA)
VDEVAQPTVPDALEEERRTTPVELLWDLVFVFAITQVTTLLWRDFTWRGFGRAMLVLALTGELVVAVALGLLITVAMYLVGHAAFALRMVGEVECEKLAVAAALLVCSRSAAASPHGSSRSRSRPSSAHCARSRPSPCVGFYAGRLGKPQL